MDTDFLERLLELFEKLQSAVLKKDTKEREILRQQIERHIGSFAQFVDTLRQCQSRFGCYNNHTTKVIEWAANALSFHGDPYPALWYEGFAHERFLIELMRWIKEAKSQADLASGAEAEQKIEPQEQDEQMKNKKQARKEPIPKTETTEAELTNNLISHNGILNFYPLSQARYIRSMRRLIIEEMRIEFRTKGFATISSYLKEWPPPYRRYQSETKTIEDTPQNTADSFKSYAKIITEKANTFVYKRDDPELARLYITYRLSIEGMVGSAKKYLNIDLPGAPELPGNDYFAGMIRLADWCRSCEAILISNIKELQEPTGAELFTQIYLSTRTITIGEKSFSPKGDLIWEFLATLNNDKNLSKSTPKSHWKSAVDSLRKPKPKGIGNENLHAIIKGWGKSSRGYRLAGHVKIKIGGR